MSADVAHHVNAGRLRIVGPQITQTTQNIIDFLVNLPVGPYGVLFLVIVVFSVLQFQLLRARGGENK